MRTRPVDAAGQVVMRDVVIRHEPRALVRPARVQASGAIRTAVHAPDPAILGSMAHRFSGPDPEQGHDDARQDAVLQGRKEGHADGYREGLRQAEAAAGRQLREAVEAAVAQARKPLLEKVRRVEALLDALTLQVHGCVDAAQDDIAMLAFDVACRVLGTHAVTREGVAGLARSMLAEWRGRQPLTICMHPDDARLLQEEGELAMAPGEAQPVRRIVIQADASVAFGGCVLHSEEGGLDARLEVQMEAFKALLLQSRASQTTVAAPAAISAPARTGEDTL